MFKIVGSCIILLCATYAGMRKYHKFYSRMRLISSIRDASIKIQNNLRCMCMPLYECFVSSGEFFSGAAEFIKEGKLPSEAVREQCKKQTFLNLAEKECINRFADGLCAGDCEGQLANIELFIAELSKYTENAEKELETKGKLCVKGSILLATAIILLMI